jgi:hypothetical protein
MDPLLTERACRREVKRPTSDDEAKEELVIATGVKRRNEGFRRLEVT